MQIKKRNYWLFGVLLLIGCASISHSSDDIVINNGVLLRGGISWIPKGFTFDAFIAPLDAIHGCDACSETMKEKLQGVKRARERFGAKSIESAKKYGANVIRLQISQPGLDSKTPIYSEPYIKSIAEAVRLIRAKGLAVMLSMTHGEWSGLTGQGGFPNASTQKAWESLAPIYKNDLGVILEIYNEPNGPQGWKKWQDSHQSLISYIRDGLGARNVIVVNGIRAGKDYRGMPPVFDYTKQLAYGVHPYLGGSAHDEEAEWEMRWGWLTKNNIVIITEWNALGKWPGCNQTIPLTVNDLLGYLHKKGLGLIGWAYDIDHTIFDPQGNPTNFLNMKCGPQSRSGAGQGIIDFMKRDIEGAH